MVSHTLRKLTPLCIMRVKYQMSGRMPLLPQSTKKVPKLIRLKIIAPSPLRVSVGKLWSML